MVCGEGSIVEGDGFSLGVVGYGLWLSVLGSGVWYVSRD